MPCWAIPTVAVQSAVAATKHVVAVGHMAPHVGRSARRLIRHHLGLGHGVAAHRTARAIWRTSLVCVPGAPLAAIFGPLTAEKVAGWLPITFPSTDSATGVGGDPAGAAFVPAGGDPYSGAPHGQPPVSVPEPGFVLVFGGHPAVAFVPAGDPYSGAPHGQPPVSVPEPGCVLVFGGAVLIAMAARRLRMGRRDEGATRGEARRRS